MYKRNPNFQAENRYRAIMFEALIVRAQHALPTWTQSHLCPPALSRGIFRVLTALLVQQLSAA